MLSLYSIYSPPCARVVGKIPRTEIAEVERTCFLNFNSCCQIAFQRGHSDLHSINNMWEFMSPISSSTSKILFLQICYVRMVSCFNLHFFDYLKSWKKSSHVFIVYLLFFAANCLPLAYISLQLFFFFLLIFFISLYVIEMSPLSIT